VGCIDSVKIQQQTWEACQISESVIKLKQQYKVIEIIMSCTDMPFFIKKIMQKLKNKTAVITGATRGMGKAIAELFAEEGANVVLGGRSEDAGNATADGIRQKGGKALFVKTDVRILDENRKLVDAALQEFGQLDIVVANAGMLGLGSLTDVSLETWKQTLDTNLNAVFYLLRESIPEMQESGGSVVVTGSIAAHKGFPNHAAYNASKGAVQAFVKQAAVDYAPNVRINLIQPGAVDTELYRSSAVAFPNADTILDEVPGTLPMKRVGTPEDIAKAVLFLAGDDASWITGTVLTVDGGASAAG
jgi:NAD(P)-dependent dehydrogenase (short-subunit alcohol dehydrogenase family)